jgi:protocatechuate 3,4-dioxygenase alpha subunit
VLEVWQADARGRYAHPEDTQDKPRDAAFAGHGRIHTDADGRFRLATIKPGPVPGPGGTVQAPHLAVSLLARGLMKRLVTRVYFPDEPGNATDYVLNLVGPARRPTLIAQKGDPAGGRGSDLRWDVVLQGTQETVFFDC